MQIYKEKKLKEQRLKTREELAAHVFLKHMPREIKVDGFWYTIPDGITNKYIEREILLGSTVICKEKAGLFCLPLTRQNLFEIKDIVLNYEHKFKFGHNLDSFLDAWGKYLHAIDDGIKQIKE